MNAVLKAGDIKPDELLLLIGGLQRREEETRLRCWIEAPDGWSFDWWPGLDGELRWCRAARDPATQSATVAIERSTAGRLFAPDGELRWRYISALGDSCYRCVFLGHVDWGASRLDDHSPELAALTRDSKQQLLWGQQTDLTPGEWIELRIPHRFRYPTDGEPERVLLETEHWCDAIGQPHFIRLCDLHPYKENN